MTVTTTKRLPDHGRCHNPPLCLGKIRHERLDKNTSWVICRYCGILGMRVRPTPKTGGKNE